jgi:hypothetical protein
MSERIVVSTRLSTRSGRSAQEVHRVSGSKRSLKKARLGSVVMALLLAGCGTDPGTSETATSLSASPAAASSAGASPSEEARTHVLSEASDDAVGITVTVPASGWSGDPGGWAMESGPDGFDPPAGMGIIAYVVDEKFFVYGDPCNWRSTRPDGPATTVDEIVSALANQASRNPSAAQKITVDGYSGKKITLHVPDDVRLRECDGGNFATFGVAGEQPALWAQGPGEIDEIWAVDVDGRIALLEGGYYPPTSQQSVDELHAILRSATFD